MDRFQDVLEDSPCHCEEGLIITYSLQEIMCWEIWYCHHTLLESSLFNLAPFSQFFLDQPFSRIRVNSYAVCNLFSRYNIVFTQNLVNLVVVTFHFKFSSAIFLYKTRSLFFNLSVSPNVNNLSIDYSEKYVRVYNLKRIPPIEFW